MKVMTIVGTRPELIKLSRTIALLDTHLNHILVHTGQNYDRDLNEIFFEDLDLRKPDYFLNINTSTFGKAIGDIISRTETVLLDEKPDVVLILGDTNSGLSALTAKRLHIPVYHLEAGNRSFDLNVPEEINRKVIDHLADFNIVYTQRAREHLLAEGLPHRRVYLSGSPMKEVLDYYKSKIEKSDILSELGLEMKGYLLLSMHREENVDNESHLKCLLEAVTNLATDNGVEVICTTHPRTRKRLEEFGLNSSWSSVRFLNPFRFTDYIFLQKHALCTLSDSGTVSEESSILNFPAVTIRNSMERPEAIDAGTITMSGLDPDNIQLCVKTTIEIHDRTTREPPVEYMVENFSERVMKLILGTWQQSNHWHGISGSS